MSRLVDNYNANECCKSLKEIEETEYAKIYRLPTAKIFCERYPINIKNKRCKELFKMLENENIDSAIIQTRFWTTSYFASKFIFLVSI